MGRRRRRSLRSHDAQSGVGATRRRPTSISIQKNDDDVIITRSFSFSPPTDVSRASTAELAVAPESLPVTSSACLASSWLRRAGTSRTTLRQPVVGRWSSSSRHWPIDSPRRREVAAMHAVARRRIHLVHPYARSIVSPVYLLLPSDHEFRGGEEET